MSDNQHPTEVGQDFSTALKEAWPYMRVVFSAYTLVVLAINSMAWTTLSTPDRWSWVLMTAVMVFVAHEKGNRNQPIQYLFISAMAFVTALWI